MTSVHPKTVVKLKAKLKELTGRSNGMGYKQRKEALALFIRGWVEYYKLARMKGYWRAASMWDCTQAMSNKNLYRAGYRCLMDYYVLVS